MNLQDNRYNKFFLIRKMLETCEMVRHLDIKKILSYEKEVKKERIFFMKNKLFFPSLTIGVLSIIFGVVFLFPQFLIHLTISSSIFLLGQVLVLFSVLIYIEELEIIKLKKSYRFFYYYSYYSFTVYIAHNLLYFVFLGQLNLYNVWYALIITMILLTLLIRGVFKKWGPNASL